MHVSLNRIKEEELEDFLHSEFVPEEEREYVRSIITRDEYMPMIVKSSFKEWREKKKRSLTELSNYFGSDKGTKGPSNRHVAHNYTDIYNAYFSKVRDEPINILEIGIGLRTHHKKPRIAHGRNESGGASIKTWEQYFPNAQIYAIDYLPATEFDSERVHTFIVDQGKRQDMERFLALIGDTTFDFIIDDGSHRADHQQLSLQLLFPHLKSGGTYFIEDLNNDGNGILPTRTLLKCFENNRLFISPNAFTDISFSKEIGTIDFYVPQLRLNKLALLAKCAGLNRVLIEYQENTELLCAITKK